jgi:ATP-dependent HslUV protease ATP-binding subunit HslU
MSQMTPREIVQELDKHIVGQDAAKRAVAIALRNRWRRAQLPEPLRTEVTPKNILMIGPTGVGKTEIARRLARLAHAPFIKVEATKFTEVGYVGRDVDSIIRELVDVSVKLTRELELEKVRTRAEDAADDRVLAALAPTLTPAESAGSEAEVRTRLRRLLREGQLDEREIEVNVQATPLNVQIMTPPGLEEMSNQLESLFRGISPPRPRRRRLKVREARRLMVEEEASRLINDEELKVAAVAAAEQQGIVFIDEIDKITRRSDAIGADVSREGVQRDLLPLVEGCTVSTKYGMVRTDHVLFIASGAFHVSKPSDLIPELQGRFPIRVELDALTADDFVRILTEPDSSLCEQYAALMNTEGFEVRFSEDGVRRLADIAHQVNQRMENIGARRLHTVLERLIEELSFTAADRAGQSITIDAQYVDRQLAELARDDDLSRYIL